ncbi:UDP-N-acetylmuramoyl-L-alanyl-D-glutamate--2,6-diaminopimelate ligase [Campylobacter sp. MIT 99-7217]|uniref:UDP-N-acetylmuramoyl-L-alanyl-D-glutamate--2, 6-diaminopimelate ligase n=1 Tax=Campylobacter sp. MIT 99-7217 TaxID=535091 RepID=UPI001158D1D0|nr:UDP-N-acetylmuramoyl-L-alanyl-D-glutamate--2,6-diaminopimelate ligase [Campylobacter sp. MIT 99-7217]TQR32351.1 UDP-N-acetylmuramoyl-L-alanyl-D-glutamate--2,6-diaminopimelate ligase [Campylobacter sp. MIT 99-7217]
MIIKLDQGFITDNSLECNENAYFVKTKQNLAFCEQANQKKAKLIDLKECKKLLNIDENIKIIGITGTNGKTTTANLIYFVLQKLGFKVAMCGTRGAFINGQILDEKGLTTSPILKTLEYLQAASKERCEFFIMEVSSHALVQDRIEALSFVAKIFTNLTQDHLDFHKSFENYKKAKESFFTDESLKIINKDAIAIHHNPKNTIFYGIKTEANYHIKKYDLSTQIKAILEFQNKEYELNSHLVGLFNLYNLLACFACINELVKPKIEDLLQALSQFQGVEGRVELVAKNVIVDFAHTPDGIEKVLQALNYKPLIVVFGAGGDRDKTKRPLMAKAVKKFAKTMIITSDNPRSEDPLEIIKDISSGIKQDESVFTEVDRKKAIQKALELQKNDDFVVILGKGDETYQEIKGIKYPFSDKIVVKELLGITC